VAISSPGVGSGLDVNSIVTQLVAIEKQPLQPLQSKASTLQAQLSLYGTIKSQVSALGDAADALAQASGWTAQTATSSNTAAVSVTASASATASAFSLSVTQLARAQTTASMNVAVDAALGAPADTGTLSIDLGSWATGSFVASASPVSVSINGTDTLSTAAVKINAANAGVTATVLRSAGQERLVFQSSSTGAAAGFRIAAAGFAGLDSLSLTGLSNPAQSASGMVLGQSGLNASVSLNGVVIDAATNTLSNVVPGLTLQLQQVTTAPVQITVAQDQSAIQKNIQTLADAYSALSKTLANATRYVPGGASGPLQGDSTTVGLQNLMRSIVGSSSTGSTYSRLSEVGLEQQSDGSLKLNTAKLTTALSNVSNLKNLFATDNSSSATNGFGLKLRDFSRGLVKYDGTVVTKSTALQGAISRNGAEQDRVTQRATRVESQLRKQYSDLDGQMAKMNALGSYVTAQLAQWNKAG
jgi:flagellar hook-associated protein 2